MTRLVVIGSRPGNVTALLWWSWSAASGPHAWTIVDSVCLCVVPLDYLLSPRISKFPDYIFCGEGAGYRRGRQGFLQRRQMGSGILGVSRSSSVKRPFYRELFLVLNVVLLTHKRGAPGRFQGLRSRCVSTKIPFEFLYSHGPLIECTKAGEFRTR